MIKFLRATKLKSGAARHLHRSQFFSTDLEPSTSHSDDTPTFQSIQLSPPLQRKGSRLRDKAGLPAFEHSALNRPTNASELAPLQRPGMFRTRTQLERAQMSHKERSIALELLEDLGIPIEEIQQDSSESPINNLLQRPEFKSVILQKQSSSNKSLLRHQPTQLSPEQIRHEDVLKELTDSQIRKMDSFETDFQLLEWVDENVFSLSRRPPSNNSPSETNSPLPLADDDLTTKTTTRLGQVFEKQDEDNQFNAELQDELDYIQDPEKMLHQPLCFTPLFSPILLHLIKLTSKKLKNPYLALYLFNWARSHPDPIVKYFGLTRETYFENLQIKWEFFKDFKGIKEDLIEMNALGLELDNQFKHFILSITRVVWEDELNLDKNLNLPCVSQAERQHVSQIESILHDFIETQNLAFAHKLRALPNESN